MHAQRCFLLLPVLSFSGTATESTISTVRKSQLIGSEANQKHFWKQALNHLMLKLLND